ncbi:MAG: hypothetical protein KAR06_05390 [Deltaproteobacteria bacterium]|nr:hypothetical protein [Deltaproteobacteria bacterium]
MNTEERLRYALSLESRGEYIRAFDEYEKVMRSTPGESRAYYGMGSVYLRVSRADEAVRNLEKAIELDGEQGPYYNRLAWAYLLAGEPIMAEMTVLKGEAVDLSGRHVFYDTRGVLAMVSGRYLEAEHHFKNALMLTPLTDYAALYNIHLHMHKLYLKTAEAEKAKASLEEMKTYKRMGYGIPQPFIW